MFVYSDFAIAAIVVLKLKKSEYIYIIIINIIYERSFRGVATIDYYF